MPSPIAPTRLIGNLAAAALVVLTAAFLWDRYLAEWVGYKPTALCTLLGPVVNIAGSIGVLLTSLGVVIWAISRFRSESGVALMVGGVLLFVAPAVLPHYLGAACRLG
ncbi:hypothetical protein [Rhizobium leguminosarum]|uniref:hypothetical protein n=1 Tax=Rhizobium leguminosarum TaxID=384 RepID=UPI003F96DC7F